MLLAIFAPFIKLSREFILLFFILSVLVFVVVQSFFIPFMLSDCNLNSVKRKDEERMEEYVDKETVLKCKQ